MTSENMVNEFIPWEGGESPVPPLSKVYVKFRNPEYTDESIPYYAQELDWAVGEDPDADADFDIIAYRVAEEQPVFHVHTGGTNPAPGQTVEVVFRGNNWVYQMLSDDFNWEHVANEAEADIILYRTIV